MLEVSHIIDGITVTPYRDNQDTELIANFGDNVQPSLNIDAPVFVNSENSYNSDTLRTLFDANPIEGGVYSKVFKDSLTTLKLDYYFDYTKLEYLSENKTKVGLVRDRSLNSLLDYNGADITMQLLIYKGVLLESDYVPIKYRAVSRKTALEKLQMVAQTYIIYKTMVDEVFKILSIAADLTSILNPATLAVAIVNLAQTIASVVILANRLGDMFIELVNVVFGVRKFYKGIPLKTVITKGLDYLGYKVDFGTVWTELDGIILLGSRNNEGVITQSLLYTQKGILEPNDFGYTLKEQFELCEKLANCKTAIVGKTVHIRPKKDPYWIQTSTFQFQDVQVGEQLFFNNGTKSFNFDELNAATIIKTATDQSDYWTINDRATDETGRTITVATVEPIQTTEAHRVNLNGIKNVEIPYSLCVRGGLFIDLLEGIENVNSFMGQFVETFKENFEDFSDKLNSTLPDFGFTFDIDTLVDSGTLKTENDFFSVPKIIYLENGNIPSDFDNKIGVKAIYEKYYKWDSLVGGIRNPENTNDTNGKQIYKGVTIDMDLTGFKQLLDNSYFNSTFGSGKMTKVAFNYSKGTAVVDFWIQKHWLKNVTEKIA